MFSVLDIPVKYTSNKTVSQQKEGTNKVRYEYCSANTARYEESESTNRAGIRYIFFVLQNNVYNNNNNNQQQQP